MSKLGRYSAQRKKVEALTAAKSITVADCGTIFTIGTADLTHTLPLLSDAGAGWWCRFIVNDETEATVIDQHGDDTANQMVGHILSYADGAAPVMVPQAAAGTAFDKVTFVNTVLQGDWVEFHTDGTLWYVEGATRIADGITAA
jgi:hypothetical protein